MYYMYQLMPKPSPTAFASTVKSSFAIWLNHSYTFKGTETPFDEKDIIPEIKQLQCIPTDCFDKSSMEVIYVSSMIQRLIPYLLKPL